MKQRVLLAFLVLLSAWVLIVSGNGSNEVHIIGVEKLSCNGVSPTQSNRIFYLMLEFHAWFLSDNSINLYYDNPGSAKSLELVAQWQVPAEFMQATAFRFAAINAETFPYPTASWIAANETHAFRFQCGPGTICYPTATPVRLPKSPSTPVLSITEIDPNDPTRQYLVSADSVITLLERHHELKVLQNLTWSNRKFYNDFPTDQITGVVRSQDNRHVLISLSTKDPYGVGYIINVEIDSFGRLSIYTITMMLRSPRTFYAYNDFNHPGLIYYWLIQNPYVDSTTHNAFVMSSGGAPQDLNAASAVFPPGDSWATDVFLFENVRQTGLLASGNDSTPGFTAWSPQFTVGDVFPEVRLRAPTHFPPSTGFAKPRFGVRTWEDFNLGQIGSVTSKNLHDGCWYVVELDWQDVVAAEYHGPKTQSSMFLKEKDAFKDNCKPSTCDLDEPADCPLEHCWGRGALGGFQCCSKPPV